MGKETMTPPPDKSKCSECDDFKGVNPVLRGSNPDKPMTVSLILGRVAKDYYFEDGGFIHQWLRDDINQLIEQAQREARDAALEEAAKCILEDARIEGSRPVMNIGTVWAQEIRSLKAKRDGGLRSQGQQEKREG